MTIPFSPNANTSLTVSSASSSVILPNASDVLILTNPGTVDAYVKLGDASVTAATTDLYIGAGRAMAVFRGGNTYLAGITASGTSTLYVAQGVGDPTFSGGGGSSGGGGGTTPSKTGTPTNVASSASSVTVLASNNSRLGASVQNDSTAILYMLLQTGGTASTTSYTIKMLPGSYYEVPFNYTGALIGIWASANGAARVTEFTA